MADTLLTSGYLPLQIGNIWEYEAYSGAFLDNLTKEKVVADTVIDGDTFYKIREVGFDPQGNAPITDADTSYSYVGLFEGSLFRWTPRRGKSSEGIEFFRDFKTCYDIGGQENAAAVGGGYDTTYSFLTVESVALVAMKDFLMFGVSIDSYGYGLGRVRITGDPDYSRNLTFARIYDQEYGERLESRFDIRVSTEKPPAHSGDRTHLEVYPNPTTASTHLALELAHPGHVSVRIYDTLGRIVDTALDDQFLPAGGHVLVWNAAPVGSGMYFARLVIDGRPAALARLVIYP